MSTYKNIIFIVLIFPLIAFGQNKEDTETEKIEILIKKLSSAEDTAKINILNKLSKEFAKSNPAKAIKYAEQAIESAAEVEYKAGIGSGYSNIGKAYRNKGNFKKATNYLLKSVEIFKQIDDKFNTARTLNSLASTYAFKGDFDQSIEYLWESLEIYEDINDKKGIANTTNNIGIIYSYLSKYEKSIEYYKKALDIRIEIGDKNDIAASYNNIGEIYLELHQNSKALNFFHKSLELQEELGRKDIMFALLINIGNVFENLNSLSQALEYYNKGLDIVNETRDQWGIATTLKDIASVYLKKKEYSESLLKYNQAINIANEINAKDLLKECYLGLSEFYTVKADYKNALDFYKLFSEIKDSIFNEESNKIITQTEIRYQTEKKEKENAYLKEREAINLITIKKQRIIAFLTGLGLLLVLILFVILYRNYIKKKKFNKLLLQKNEEINLQKEELSSTLENLKQTQNQLIQTAKMASLGQLTAGVAHELNNPISFIHGNISPLERDIKDILLIINKYDSQIEKHKLEDKFKDVGLLKKELDYKYLISEINNLLIGINEGALRSSEIVKGLRSFSRLDDEHFTEADIQYLIDSTLAVLKNKTKNRIKIHKEYSDLGLIECLPTKLNQVFMNLLANSIQAIDKTGDIFIKTWKDEKNIKISIKDTGYGMSKEVMKHIFEPFFTTKDIGEGTGLGLSISYGIIEKHNGEIDVISELGKGSEFIISIPLSCRIG